MRIRKVVGVIGVAGLVIGLLSCGGSSTRAGRPDAVLRMVPADCLFCVRINDLDRTLGELDQYLAGVSPTAAGPAAKTQLGGLLGNSTLAGVKTDGVFAFFGSAPADAQGPDALMRGLSILIPVSDHEAFTAGSPKLSEPDAQGVSSLAGTPLYAAKAGDFVLMGPAADAVTFAALAKTIKARPEESLADVLDADETARAMGSPLWIRANIPAVAKLLGPGLGEEIRKAAAGAAKTPAGPMPGLDPKALFDMYGGLAETLLKETDSLTVTVEPKPALASLGLAVAARPGTPMADLLTKSRPSGLKDSKLLGYLEDGAVMNGAASFDPASLIRFSEMGLDLMSAMEGLSLSEADAALIKALVADSAAVLSGEMAFSVNMASPATSPYSATYVFELRDPDKWPLLFDKAADLMNAPFFAAFFDSAGMKMDFKVLHGAATYQGVSIDSVEMTFASKDADSPQAQMMQGLYNSLEYRMATVGRLGVMAIGADADAKVRTLIDLAQAGGSRTASAEFAAAMEALPDAMGSDYVLTYNIVRMLGMGRAMMPNPLPAESFASKSSMIIDFGMGQGKASVRMALPKEHLIEIVRTASLLEGK